MTQSQTSYQPQVCIGGHWHRAARGVEFSSVPLALAYVHREQAIAHRPDAAVKGNWRVVPSGHPQWISRAGRRAK